MKTTISRVAYCRTCHDAGRPKTDNVYAVKGSRGWHVHIVEYAAPHTNPEGYTPHIFQLDKVVDGNVYFTKTCGMHTCGVYVTPKEESDKYSIGFLNQEKGVMTIANWNSLVTFKDTGYRLE